MSLIAQYKGLVLRNTLAESSLFLAHIPILVRPRTRKFFKPANRIAHSHWVNQATRIGVWAWMGSRRHNTSCRGMDSMHGLGKLLETKLDRWWQTTIIQLNYWPLPAMWCKQKQSPWLQHTQTTCTHHSISCEPSFPHQQGKDLFLLYAQQIKDNRKTSMSIVL